MVHTGDKKSEARRGRFRGRMMVKSWICPKCLGDLNIFHTEEGDTMVATDKVVCPHCRFTLEGPVSECTEDADNEETGAAPESSHE